MSFAGLPILKDSVSSLQCVLKKVDQVADHIVYYGEVADAFINDDESLHPMLYYQRQVTKWSCLLCIFNSTQAHR